MSSSHELVSPELWYKHVCSRGIVVARGMVSSWCNLVDLISFLYGIKLTALPYSQMGFVSAVQKYHQA